MCVTFNAAVLLHVSRIWNGSFQALYSILKANGHFVECQPPNLRDSLFSSNRHRRLNKLRWVQICVQNSVLILF
ncbi:hypothetical protein VTL71DRAFT_14944 [Oculimacula yallundae]|uniref:Uncharacterized protein n=1 Tax=Oculimacula yallundae TaxID=86028 RepID=A0ABR4CFY0_9HELO